jgi:hypothetical protein
MRTPGLERLDLDAEAAEPRGELERRPGLDDHLRPDSVAREDRYAVVRGGAV